MMTFLSEGLGRLGFRLGRADERISELEAELQKAREVVGPAWLKASKGDLAEAMRLKCARFEKDTGDAEAECRELHRKLDEMRSVQDQDAMPVARITLTEHLERGGRGLEFGDAVWSKGEDGRWFRGSVVYECTSGDGYLWVAFEGTPMESIDGIPQEEEVPFPEDCLLPLAYRDADTLFVEVPHA